MIDHKVFKVEWSILAVRFGKEFPDPVIARYYQHLTDRMDTAEFRAACQRIFAGHEFFPTPDDFLEDKATDALRQWELAERAIRGLDPDLSRLSDAGQRTVRLLGGLRHLKQMRESDLPFRRKEFLELHETIEHHEHHELPAWTAEGRATMERLSGGTVDEGAA